MARARQVDVTVRIKDKFSDQIRDLKTKLRSIQSRVDVDLFLDDNGKIDLTKASLADIDNLIQVLVDVRDGGLDAALAKAEALDGKKATIQGGMDFEPGFERRMRNFSEYGGAFPPDPSSFQNRDSSGGFASGFHSGLPKLHPTANKQNLPVPRTPRMDMRDAIPKDSLGLSMRKRAGILSERIDNIEGFGGALRKLKPSMHKWMNLIAAMVPMLITLGTQALGVAAAMGAVGVAGAGLMTGLLGYGNGLEDSLDKGKKRVGEFAKELFKVFEPTFDAIQPITEQLLGEAPAMLQKFATSLYRVTEFDETVFAAFEGLSNWLAESLDRMADMEGMLSQLAMRFGDIVGQEIIGFLEFITQEAYNNQDALIDLARVFKNVIHTIYNLSKTVSYAILGFSGLFDIARGLSQVLQNETIVSFIKWISTVWLLVEALKAMNTMLQLIHKNLKRIGLYAGLAVVGMAADKMLWDSPDPRGPSGPPGGASPVGGGGGSTYVMNVDGDVTNRHMDKFADIADDSIATNETDDEWMSRS